MNIHSLWFLLVIIPLVSLIIGFIIGYFGYRVFKLIYPSDDEGEQQ